MVIFSIYSLNCILHCVVQKKIFLETQNKFIAEYNIYFLCTAIVDVKQTYLFRNFCL